MAQQPLNDEVTGVPSDTLATRLVLARVHAGHLSIRVASARCHIGRQSWWNWEHGRHTPRHNDGLGVSLRWLVEGGPLTPGGDSLPARLVESVQPAGPTGGPERRSFSERRGHWKLPRPDSNGEPAGFFGRPWHRRPPGRGST